MPSPPPHVRERGSGVLNDFLVTAPRSESSNQIAERHRAREPVCLQCSAVRVNGECNNLITFFTPFDPAPCDKNVTQNTRPDPLSAFRGRGLGTRLVYCVRSPGLIPRTHDFIRSLIYISLAKPDQSIARGSGRKPILRFVPAAGILQSNQIAERAITTY